MTAERRSSLQTRGILTNVTETCPGRFHDEIEYVTVAGKFVKGASLREPGDRDKQLALLRKLTYALLS